VGRAFFWEGSWTIPDKEWHDNFALNLFAAIRLTKRGPPGAPSVEGRSRRQPVDGEFKTA